MRLAHIRLFTQDIKIQRATGKDASLSYTYSAVETFLGREEPSTKLINTPGGKQIQADSRVLIDPDIWTDRAEFDALYTLPSGSATLLSADMLLGKNNALDHWEAYFGKAK